MVYWSVAESQSLVVSLHDSMMIHHLVTTYARFALCVLYSYIPTAKHVMNYLSDAQTSADVSRRIPFMFITNGGGVLEREKAHEISDVFFPGLPVPVR